MVHKKDHLCNAQLCVKQDFYHCLDYQQVRLVFIIYNISYPRLRVQFTICTNWNFGNTCVISRVNVRALRAHAAALRKIGRTVPELGIIISPSLTHLALLYSPSQYHFDAPCPLESNNTEWGRVPAPGIQAGTKCSGGRISTSHLPGWVISDPRRRPSSINKTRGSSFEITVHP